ncbi:uncharacterized protein LOC124927498 [Impatiens glandulifera]|uniref:uncharacterized protein LOC124927498 n=1 Tax=Impatiens glandulifera TaxID=253017 RepID=UPI001FB08805|nr:uncharacterized protein LOC124927498 [Impatiens glandulifera]XP_047323872.1 uncharacterized protein LOC124927498 [Impatiens glandulifera]XP_047323873.1 uncharacterized protein LOC124927498 [Impatiens glandulifera]
MKTDNFNVKKLVRDKKFWFASFLIVWAAGLQGHMMWMKKQDSFKEKFVDRTQVKDQPKDEFLSDDSVVLD